MSRQWRRCTSKLIGTSHPLIPDAHLQVIDEQTARAIDETWQPLRSLAATNRHWLWDAISRESADRFALFRQDQPLAAWAATIPVVEDGDDVFYWLDRFEVCPADQGKRIGTALISLVCERAVELNAQAVVLGSLPSATLFYEAIGARRGAPPDWPWDDPKLIPFTIDGQRFAELGGLDV